MTGRLFTFVSVLALTLVQSPGRVFVVVFDEQHLTSASLRRLQAAATRLFTNEFESGDLGGVVIDGRMVNDRLLSDRDELIRAVQRAHPRVITASDLEASTQVGGGVEQSRRLAEIAAAEDNRAALSRKLSSLEALVQNLARVDGPKAVVLLSEAFGGDGSSAGVREVIAAAAKAGVRFHVLDESGNERDAAGALVRETGGVSARKAASFDAAIASVAKATVAFAANRPSGDGASANMPVASATPEPVPSTGAATPVATPPTAAAPSITKGVVVAAPSEEPGVLRVRPLTESTVMDLAGSDWSDAAARAGWDAYQRGELESARAILGPIAARPVAPSWVEYVLGQADYALGEFKDAAVAWERVRTRQPQFQPVYLDLADDYVKLNERKRAIDVLKEGRKRWPRDGDMLNAYGVIVGGGGNLDEAIQVFNEAIALAPRETISVLNLAKTLELRYFQKRRNLTMLRWRPGDAEEKERQDAIKAYERYLATGGPYGDLAREGIERLKNAPVPARRRG
jgi:tetratricopeptide (TPR) repeat protein